MNRDQKNLQRIAGVSNVRYGQDARDTRARSRRDFLSWVGNGLFSASLASLLLQDNVLRGAVVPGESKETCPHFLPKAKRGYELAAKMQLAVPEVTDVAGETEATREMYGLNGKPTADFGRGCLLARRLIERGVRFVQLFSGGTFGSPRRNWDGHEDMVANHSQEALRIDQPVAALLKDLRQRGMLDDTLVLFTTEFGRTPFTQSAANVVGKGRDHNQYGFTVWMAGAGLKSGMAYGATDEVGWKSVLNPMPWYDFHATVLSVLGIDHERLTFYHNGIQRRLTNVHGKVIGEVLA